MTPETLRQVRATSVDVALTLGAGILHLVLLMIQAVTFPVWGLVWILYSLGKDVRR